MGLRDGQRASIDVSFIFGDDWRVSDLTDAELLAYFRLWGRAVQYRVHLLPPKFNVHNHSKLAQEVKSHRDTAANMLRKCRENALVSVRDDGRILVAGVGVKHSWMVFKDGPNGEGWQSKNGKPYFDKDEGCRMEDEGSKDEGEEAPPPIISDFPEVYKTLRAINAHGYRDLSVTPEFDKVLSSEKARLGAERIHREAQRFALWLEGRLQSGEEKRTKRSRPYKRFADWLAREKAGDNGNRSSAVDEFGRKETPTGRILRLAREEQARECERAESS